MQVRLLDRLDPAFHSPSKAGTALAAVLTGAAGAGFSASAEVLLDFFDILCLSLSDQFT
jgi:hypothetical protein